jgi:hypothetical protein
MDDFEEYNSPIKNEAREKALYHAVECLTQYREQSVVVPLDQFGKTIDYVCDHLDQIQWLPVPHEQVAEDTADFTRLHRARVGRKTPGELIVLFLAGPKPSNDIRVLQELGIPLENMWAIEGGKDVFEETIEDLQDEGLGVRIYRGSLAAFLEMVPQQFDIVYFDSCSPLLGGVPNTVGVLRELFAHQRLAPLSVLITNFSEAGWRTDTKEWAKRLGTWTALRRGEDEPQELEEHFAEIESDLPSYYGEFITKFLIECSGQLLPWWRSVALPGVQREFFSSEKALDDALRVEAELQRTIEGSLFQHSFVELRNVAKLASKVLLQDDPLRKQFFDFQIGKVKLANAIHLAAFMRNFGSGMTEKQEAVYRAACSDDLVGVLEFFRWFDYDKESGSKVFTDFPGPHLLADLLFGIYGFPYHANVSRLKRWKYTAQETPMYLDAIVFDQCRYFYDLAPTLPLFLDELRFGRQVVLRCCMDAIFRHCKYVEMDLFHGATLIGEGKLGLPFHEMPLRSTITIP